MDNIGAKEERTLGRDSRADYGKGDDLQDTKLGAPPEARTSAGDLETGTASAAVTSLSRTTWAPDLYLPFSHHGNNKVCLY